MRLSDYRPSPWRLLRTDLEVGLFDDHATVAARLVLEPDPVGLATWQAESGASAAALPPLELRGVELQTLALAVDGQPLHSDDYRIEADRLLLLSPPERPFLFSSVVRIEPQRNVSLQGLYVSGGMFTTQCEAEGFRRITWHPDRPDLLSRFRVRLEADRARCPVLLSNGNRLESGRLPATVDAAERHYAIWDDPFPKPSYLFALVAGRLEQVSERFITASGRPVELRLWVEPGDEPYTSHALASLQRAMRWDEEVYGLEYDLDEYNVVAVRHFNMGAMENKSLNIFNSKLVLADAEIATDDELECVESVIAHEYFHNWTGNRITCRDWFQLSVKEGLTVFRDQCFSADLHGNASIRIPNVALLRNVQFREDSGPTAHPIQPDEYQEIDNFYTTTIYEKGAEVIRCLQTLLGEHTFRRGIALYIQRHDGTATTCDDFLSALQEVAEADWAAAGRDAPPPFSFSDFRRWYHQAGTPHVQVQRHWDASGVLELTLRQHTPATPGQEQKQPLVIPLALGAIGQDGQALTLRLDGETAAEAHAQQLPTDGWGRHTRLMILDQEERRLRFVGLPPRPQPPALSLLRGFSAPVRLAIGRPAAELVHLLRWDSDPFARWDAAQVLLSQALLARAAGSPEQPLEEELVDAYAAILSDPTLSQASRGLLMELPGLAELEQVCSGPPDPPALHAARLDLMRWLGEALAAPLDAALAACIPGWSEPWPAGQGDRRLTAMIWSWRVAAHDPAAIAAAQAAVQSASMTLARAGLRALQPWPLPARHAALDAFHDRWQERPVILDAWFALEAGAPFADGLERVARLLEHPRFDPTAPNSVRAVLGGLAGNPPVFHAADGSGYRFLASRIAELDQRNPITASRLVKVFSRWRSYAPERSAQMGDALRQLMACGLSPNCREVVEQCLAD